jgi:general secretion pathway protein A
MIFTFSYSKVGGVTVSPITAWNNCMYKEYFGFHEYPFSISPDPRFLYLTAMHQEALAHLSYGAQTDGCITLLTGEVGTGKTTICRCFLENIDAFTEVAVILNPRLTARGLVAAICDEFQIAPTLSRPTVKDYIDCLNRFLLTIHADNRQAILVIDEAQNLDLEVIEMVRMLTNLETNTRKLLKIFLIAQSELAEQLTSPELRQINQRVTSRYHLDGLNCDEVRTYIAHRIAVAGGGRAPLFSGGAITRICRLSRGIPRLINTLCDRALLGAYAQEKERVNKAIVDRAAREVFGGPVNRLARVPFAAKPYIGLLLLLLLIAAFSLTLPQTLF